MIHDLRIENYRSIRTLKMSGLQRVNLIVGRNNAGKTSILEAIEFLASGGNPRSLYDVAARRGDEVTVHGPGHPTVQLPPASQFFPGRLLRPGVTFTVVANAESRSAWAKVVAEKTLDSEPESLRLRVKGDVEVTLRLTAARTLPVSFGSFFFGQLPERPTVVTLPVGGPESDWLARAWADIAMKRQEGRVTDLMRILEPELLDVVITPPSSDERSKVLLGFQSKSDRTPLEGQGEGTRRLLAIAISMVLATNGTLLIDEIDTGLHYSILPEFWTSMIEMARLNGTQVFATTHSLDCLRALAQVTDSMPDFQSEVAVSSIAADVSESVALNAYELQAAVEHDLEVRG